MSHTPIRKLGHFAAEHLTWLSLCGLVAVITGFTPEEWVAHLAENLRVSGVVDGHWPKYLDIRAVLVAVGVGVIVTDVLLKRRSASRPVSPAPAGTVHGVSTPLGPPASATATREKDTIRHELGRLLKRAPSRKTVEAQRAWAAEVKPLLDTLLGPGPTNIHSEMFYEFDFAANHAEKTAVLRGILLSGGSSAEAAVGNPARTNRDRSRARNNDIVADALKARPGVTDCWVMQLEDHSDKGYLLSVAFDTTLSAAEVLSMVREVFAQRLPHTPIFGEMKSESEGKVSFAYTYLDEHNQAFKSSGGTA